jgi:hypothetical protein
VGGLEPKIYVHDMKEAAKQQAGAREEDAG